MGLDKWVVKIGEPGSDPIDDGPGFVAPTTPETQRQDTIAETISILSGDTTSENEMLEFFARIRSAVAHRLKIHPIELDSVMVSRASFASQPGK